MTRAFLLLAAVIAVAPAARAQLAATEYDGAAALGLALRRLGPTQRVLMIAAHPDDENTSVLSTLALGHGADVAYLALTRGDGGQNAIGPELQEAVGLIRSEELLAARRLDGARQFFTRAYDYGYSKSAAEAFRHWPKDSVLADVVAVIRRFRPDLVVSVFTGTPRDGHGQHQAAGILAREAFAAAGDPSRFPDQLARGLRPHQPAKLYQSRWRGTPAGAVPLETGTYDPLLGRSYHQIAMASRSRHRSQQMGRTSPPGPRQVALNRVDAETPGEHSIFAGVDTTLSARARALGATPERVRTLAAYDEAAVRIRAGFNALDPGGLVPELARALGLIERAAAALAGRDDAGAAELRFHVEAERADARAALALAAGVVVDAVAEEEVVIPGQRFTVELTVWNGGTRPVSVRALEPVLPEGWRAEPEASLAGGPLEPGTLAARRFTVRVPADAPASEPYYLRRPRDGDLYRWPADPRLRGLPFQPPPLGAVARVAVAGVEVPIEREVQYLTARRTEGEVRRPVRVVPAVSVALDPAVAVLPLNGAGVKATSAGNGERARGPAGLHFTVELTAEAPDGVTGTLGLELPAGWIAEPEAEIIRFTGPGERRQVEFRVVPPAGAQAGAHEVRAVFRTPNGRRYDRGYQLVDYPHIRPRPLYRAAVSTVHTFDVRVAPGVRVAYIPGAGDRVPQALAQLGVAPRIIEPADVATAELDAYDVIVLGIRAYEHRPEVRAQNRRLLEYVEHGGTLIVQYNQYTFSRGEYAPYPLEIARPHDRVTDETAPIRILDPSHPAVSWPNRITAADFEGWVQERGLYFPHTWDDRYRPLLEMSDPGESPLRGALLVAPYGEGIYVYTGIAFFRQLPAGVPGAYRLFANLLSLGAR